jgi:glutamate-1-semialdehyde aminotransferase
MQNLRFCNSGSEACLFSILIARHATNRPKILVFSGCYMSMPMTTQDESGFVEAVRVYLSCHAGLLLASE